MKNILTLVQAIANQSFRDTRTVADAREALLGRVTALSQAHEILTQTSWTSASIRTVVASAIEPYLDRRQKRFSLDGPEVRLAPGPALALAMALHELCTNAAKYGALSNETGRVSIAWRFSTPWTSRASASAGPEDGIKADGAADGAANSHIDATLAR